jgi:hypothetical protein
MGDGLKIKKRVALWKGALFHQGEVYFFIYFS